MGTSTKTISKIAEIQKLVSELSEDQKLKVVSSIISDTTDEQSKFLGAEIREHRKNKGFTKSSGQKPHLEARKVAKVAIENQAFGLNKCYRIAVNLTSGKGYKDSEVATKIEPKNWVESGKDFNESQLDFVMKSLKNTCMFLSKNDKDAGKTSTLTPKMLIEAWVRAASLKPASFSKIAYPK